RALSRGGLRKNPDSEGDAQKATKKKWFLIATFHCVSGQTLEQGFRHFALGRTRVSGFGLKRAGIPHPDFGEKCHFFTSVSTTVWTLVKKSARGVFWISTSRKFQAKPLNTGRAL